MRPFLRRLGRFTVYTSGSLVAAAALALLYFHYVQHRRSGERRGFSIAPTGYRGTTSGCKLNRSTARPRRFFAKKVTSLALFMPMSAKSFLMRNREACPERFLN